MPVPAFTAEHFLNRELSWLEFNARVLEEAQNDTNPLLERVKFLSIFSSNLDEFFMVRVAGLREQAFGHLAPQDPRLDGMGPAAQLRRISFRTRQLVDQQYACWNESVRPSLDAAGVRIVDEASLDSASRKQFDKYFRQRVYPVLTPLAIDPSHPSPRFHNRGFYLAADLKRRRGIGPDRLVAVVQLPQALPRFVPVRPEGGGDFVPLEDIIATRLPELFGGYEIISCGPFRVTRDMDINLLDEEGDDMLRAIESRLRARQRSEAVRIEASVSLSGKLLDRIAEEERVHRNETGEPDAYDEVYRVDGLIDMTGLMDLTSLVDRKDLREPRFSPRVAPAWTASDDVFEQIDKKDILLHHPFDSFQPVVSFVQQAARDPNVLAIKQTLYRTSGDSPIIQALIDAAEEGKHVTALVELKARFDEAANIGWARRMEQAGVHVVFGFMDLKTHCKCALVVRQEGKKVRRYAHLGTGNYNPTTARLYTDMGLFTADKAIADDVSALFNFLTGYSQGHDWQKLIVAPQDLHDQTIAMIDEQAQRARDGKRSRVIAKLNSLVDRPTIEALYRASQAGTPIDLIIRGVCCLRPGQPGLSENIRVVSVVDRFLEHSRVLVFGEGSSQKVFLSSADWMPRNFNRRVEVMFPIEDADLKRRVVEEVLPVYLADNQRARQLHADGSYAPVQPRAKERLIRSQQELINLANGVSPAPLGEAGESAARTGGSLETLGGDSKAAASKNGASGNGSPRRAAEKKPSEGKKPPVGRKTATPKKPSSAGKPKPRGPKR
ncbi:MAG: polyphosphate kinase 1 [Planctomycetota bacterium]